MTDATLLTDRARPAVRLERHLPDPPPVVWQALTEREQLRSWFPSDVIVEGGRWELGATITFPFPPEVMDMTLTGEVLEIDKPSVLAFTWGEDTLRFELSAEDGGTHLVLIDELPAGAAARNAAGWERCLDRLAGLEPAPDGWQPRFERYAAAFEPVLGPQEGPPAGPQGRQAGAARSAKLIPDHGAAKALDHVPVAEFQSKNFRSPDQIIRLSKLTAELVEIGELTSRPPGDAAGMAQVGGRSPRGRW